MVTSGFDISRLEVTVLDMRPDHCAATHRNKGHQIFTEDLYSFSQKCLISSLVETEAI